MAIKLEMLRCFVVVARCGNLMDAANKLGRTPSAISMMLKQFEEHLGSPLFESDRKSKLTALGHFTLAEASRELEHFEHSVSMIENFAQARSGLVRIAAVPSVAVLLLPKAMQRYLGNHSDVSVDMRDMDSVAVHRELEKERIDLGIASGAGAGAEIERETLFSDAFGVVCPKDHPLTEISRPLLWEDLEALPFITNGLCKQIEDEKLQDIISKSHLMVHNTTSLLALVRQGVGVTVVPRMVVDRSDKSLSFLPVANPEARRSIEILRRADAVLSPAARHFEEAIRFVTQEIMSAE